MAEVTIKSYRKEREKEIMDGLEKSMIQVKNLVMRQAIQNADKPRGGSEHPQRQTGRLITNIAEYSHVEKSGSEITAVIGTNIKAPPYPHFLEFGNSRQPPYPFLFPAVEMQRDKIVETLKGKEFEVT